MLFVPCAVILTSFYVIMTENGYAKYVFCENMPKPYMPCNAVLPMLRKVKKCQKRVDFLGGTGYNY